MENKVIFNSNTTATLAAMDPAPRRIGKQYGEIGLTQEQYETYMELYASKTAVALFAAQEAFLASRNTDEKIKFYELFAKVFQAQAECIKNRGYKADLVKVSNDVA